jgi:hypothetical protein
VVGSLLDREENQHLHWQLQNHRLQVEFEWVGCSRAQRVYGEF